MSVIEFLKTRFASANGEPEGGFILIMTGLLIIPIVAFTALAIDVSAWYSRATELQRTADAASLAGVVWMPNLGDAQTHAKPVLEKNGIDTSDATRYDINMTVGGTSAGSFRVCITDREAPQFFGAVVGDRATITRCATSEYNQPLQLGSPLNYFGGNSNAFPPGTDPPPNYWYNPPPDSDFGPFGNSYWTYCDVVVDGETKGYWRRRTWDGQTDYTSSSHEYWKQGMAICWATSDHLVIPSQKSPGMWAAVEGYSQQHANGDAYSTHGDEYRDTGYWYSIDIPPGGVNGDEISIQAWDGTSNCELGCRTPMGDESGPHTRFRVFKAGDMKFDMSALTPADCSSGSADSGYMTSDSDWNLKWHVLCQVSVSAGQRYYVQVQSSDSDNDTHWGGGYNGYALRAVAGSFPAACLAKLPVADVECYGTGAQPRLSGYGDMEMYNNIPEGIQTEFYLADVTPTYKGHTLVIDLFDPGDGAPESWVTVMAPSETSTKGTPLAASACQVFSRNYGSQTEHDVPLDSGPGGAYANTCTIQTSHNGNNAYNDHWLRFKIQLPNDYGPDGTEIACDDTVTDPVNDAGSCWWQIKYFTQGGRLDDYTTWSAHIIGDPVRLTE